MLFIPSAKPSEGTGHLKRCLELLAHFPNGYIFHDTDGELERIRTVAAASRTVIDERRIVNELSEGWDFLVIDRRATSPEEFERYSACGPTIGLDEGGATRGSFSYLIDTLPTARKHGEANSSSIGFQPVPENRRSEGAPDTGRVLVTFGGEDPANLTEQVARALIDEGVVEPGRLTVVVGPLFSDPSIPAGVRRLEAPNLLREELYQYDLVFTSFGLTAYEALRAGVSPILVNPTAYHRSLSRQAGFPEAGVGTLDGRYLRGLLADREGLKARCRSLGTAQSYSLPAHIAGFSTPASAGCPVCGARVNGSVARFTDRSFFRCDTCSIVYELDFSRKRSQYDRSYFFEEYRRQYGRTYLEDFDNIRGHAHLRLSRISRISRGLLGKRILDVGCAFGPFLVEAKAQGGEVFGVDLSEDAVEYVQSTLGLPCENAPLESFDLSRSFGIQRVDIVTMWYVIEHFSELGRVIEKINSMLPIGGIFAFSTPNLTGISGRTDRRDFLASSPYDHFTVWSPRIARAVLRRYGFSIRSTRVTGHHPERFPVRGSARPWLSRLLRGLSRVLRFGDTFECYAIKRSEIAP